MQKYVSNVRKKLPYFIIVLFVCILQMTASAVTVKANNTVKPTKLSLKKSEMVCKPGDDLWLNADKDNTMPANANRNMNWETSDATIVEVDKSFNGLESCRIKAKKIGTAVITGTSVTDENIKVQCTINVVEGQYSYDGVWVLDKDGNLTIVDSSYGYMTNDYPDKVKKAKVILTEKCGAFGFQDCTKMTHVEFVVKNSAKVTDLSNMFNGCSSLKTVDLSGLDTSKVTDMSHMFSGCSSLKTIDISGMDTSKVTDMSHMFSGCSSLKTIDISGMDTSKVSNMSDMFKGCSSLKTIDISGMDTSKVTDMSYMFYCCSSLKTIDISKLDTSKVTDMSDMFSGSGLKTVNMSGLNLSKVKDLSDAFSDCTNLENINMSNLYAPNVKKVAYMFRDCKKLKNINMSGVNFSKAVDIATIFGGDRTHYDGKRMALETVDMSNMDLSNTKSLSNLFSRCYKLKTVDMKNLQIPKVTDMSYMFWDSAVVYAPSLEKLKTVDMRGVYAPKLKKMAAMFLGCKSLKNVYFDNMKASNIQNADGLFEACTSLETIDVSSLGFKNATVGLMFLNCSSLKKVNMNTIHKSTITFMPKMFGGCTSLKKIYMNNLDVSKVTDMSYMFTSCSSLETLELSGWKPSKVEEMEGMFWNCTNLKKVDLGNFDTSNVSTMHLMFYGCSKLQEVNMENFTLSSKLAKEVTGGYIVGVGDMFTGCNSLKYIKTPKNVQVDVRLPYEMYTSAGKGCSMLPRGGSTMLSVNGYKPTATKAKKLSMNKTSVKMKKGEKIILYATASPMSDSKNVKWKSSNKKIATVDSKGNVKAKKAGSVTITATSKSNKKLKATCKITVYSKIKSVKLSATKNTLVVGEKLSLKTTVSPKTAEKNFWYRSSNPAVAKVDANGKVVANKEGVTTITVTSMENKKVTAKYVITVKSKVNSATSKGANITPTLMPNTPEVPMSIDSIISPEVPSAIGMTISTEVPLAK